MARLLFFAALRDAAGGAREMRTDAPTIGVALRRACETYGDGFEKVLAICSVLHGEETVKREELDAVRLADDDIVAILPPVSGGSDFEMIDVGDKEETKREATAACRFVTTPAVREMILAGTLAKGDAIAPAKVAGTLAAKRVPDLIPLCHPVRTTYVGIDCEPDGDDAIVVRAVVRGRDRTGFEVEALTAASVAALTLYDFSKAHDPRAHIEALRIIAKSGGKSGDVRYE